MRRGLVVAVLLAGPVSAQEGKGRGVEFFEKRIRPVLIERCYSCHSAKAKSVKAELYLDSREGLIRGGISGPAVVPGHPDKSLLIQAIRYSDEDLGMPPKIKDRLTARQIADFENWVTMGAPDPRKSDAVPAARPRIDFEKARRFWSFRPVKDPALPAVRDEAWVESPIDRFILARLEENGLRPGPDAARRTLLRRVTLDLTGLPPTPEELEAFLADDSPGALSKVVDRLLGSPHYGERWGRHWLDVVRYADTGGDNSDYPIPQAYRYRNYVLKSFNEDKPFDRFVREQIAGDLLEHRSEEERREGIVATGYVAIARRFVDSIEKYHHLTLEDTIDTMGKSLLGLSMTCSRCHDHKYDPILMDDYYALYGIFQSTRYPYPGCETTRHQKDMVPLIPPAEADAVLKPYRDKLSKLEAALKRLGEEAKAAREELKKKPSEELKKKVKRLTDEARKRKRERDVFAVAGRPRMETAYAVAEGKPENARMHVKGDPRRLGKEIPRRFLEVLGGQPLGADAKGSGRAQLARWLTDPKNPLTPRVMANRIWHYHFGRGIVATPNDFGARGARPTHPALLDWLTSRFIESGWSVKSMHRLILSSHAYRLASGTVPALEKADPDNTLFGRFRRRRLEAEVIRDSMLALGGNLDRSVGGPHPFPPETKWLFTASRPFTAAYPTNRRSVYLVSGRIRKHPFFEVFDGADPNLSTGRRLLTTTPLQALYLMNDGFVSTQADGFAGRLIEAGGSTASRVDAAYRMAYGREASSSERDRAERFLSRAREQLAAAGIPEEKLERTAWASYARVVFSSNEFLYLD